jgi:hypothetical protein
MEVENMPKQQKSLSEEEELIYPSYVIKGGQNLLLLTKLCYQDFLKN